MILALADTANSRSVLILDRAFIQCINKWFWWLWMTGGEDLPQSEVLLEKCPAKQHPFQHVPERTGEHKIERFGRQWPDLIIHFICIYCFLPISFLKGVRRDSFCVIPAHVISDPAYLELNVEWWSVSKLKYYTFKQCLHTCVCGLRVYLRIDVKPPLEVRCPGRLFH